MALKQESKLVQALISEVQSGKSSAYEQLYRTHIGRIFTFGLRFFEHDKESAEDLSGKVFVNAFEHINTYPENTTFILWLKKITVEEIRKGDFEKPKDTHQTSLIDQAIFELPAEERIVFILHDIDKHSMEEVTEITSFTENEINLKLDQARKFMIEKISANDLSDLDYKVNFVSQKFDPEPELWNSVYNEIHKIATKDYKEDEGNENILNIGDEKNTLSEKFQKLKEVSEKRKIFLKPLKMTPTRRTMFTLVFFLLIIAAFAYIIFIRPQQWEVINLSGNPSIKGDRKNIVVENSSTMEEKDILITNNISKALIKIPGTGEISLEPGTSVKRTGNGGEISVNSGGIKILKKEGTEPFPVQVYFTLIEDYKPGSYSISIENLGAKVYSTGAYLVITSGKIKTYVLPEFICEIRSNSNVGVPYSLSASEEYINAVNDFSFKAKNERLNFILLLSDERDALTLFNILPRVSEDSREIVIKKLRSVVDIPDDIKYYDVANLNEEALQKWLNAIEMPK